MGDVVEVILVIKVAQIISIIHRFLTRNNSRFLNIQRWKRARMVEAIDKEIQEEISQGRGKGKR